MQRRRALRRLLALTALAALTGCSPDPAAAPGADQQDPGLAHVHGLGVDPADGVLYAASHFGVFRLPDGADPVRVADRFQDTMGFTVVGPRTFVASGHPDFRKDPDLPPRLGLIRSEDAAETWSTVSLTGQADLHALAVAGGTLYAADAVTGRLLASDDDGTTWQQRGEVPAFDVAASPADPAAVVVTTEDGVRRSSDGGRTFSEVAAPPLAVLGWDAADALYGVAVDGTVHVSADGGATWQERGSLGGAPEALTAVDGVLYAAVDGRVVRSGDGGRSWTTRYEAT